MAKTKTINLVVGFKSASGNGPGKSAGIGFHCNFTSKFDLATLQQELIESEVHATLKVSDDGETEDMFTDPLSAKWVFHKASVGKLGFDGRLTCKEQDDLEVAKRLQEFAGRDGNVVFKRIGDASVKSEETESDDDDPDQTSLADSE